MLTAIVPVEDIREHSEFNPYCLCNPKMKEGLIIHFSFDGREYLEPNSPIYLGTSKAIIYHDSVPYMSDLKQIAPVKKPTVMY